MRAYWSILSNIGLRPHHDSTELKKIRLLNQLCIVIVPFLLIFLVRDAIEGDTSGVLLTLTVMAIVASAPILQKMQLFRTARWTFVVFMIIMVTVLIMLYGPNLGGEFICMVSVLVVLILFDEIRDQVLLFAMIFGSYIFSQVYLLNHPALFEAELSPFSKELLFLASIACLILLTMVFIQENLYFELHTRELLQSLQEKNDVLRQKQEEIEQQNQKLAQANEELEKFAYVASHDLRTPLRSINGFLTLIERRLRQKGVMDEEIGEFFQLATNGAKQMHYLIGDILEYSRLNREAISPGIVDLNDVLKQVIHHLSELIEEKHASVLLDSLPPVLGVESQLLLLLQNLIENGIKYNESPQPMIRVGFERSDDFFTIFVADNGIGIPAEYQGKIFDMFTRLHSAAEYSGSGIGLAICKKIIHFCEGSITLESQAGEGTTFYIHLPDHMLLPVEQQAVSLV